MADGFHFCSVTSISNPAASTLFRFPSHTSPPLVTSITFVNFESFAAFPSAPGRLLFLPFSFFLRRCFLSAVLFRTFGKNSNSICEMSVARLQSPYVYVSKHIAYVLAPPPHYFGRIIVFSAGRRGGIGTQAHED